MAIRLLPLRREVRRLALERNSKRSPADISRWLVLIACYALTLLLTAPFYFRRPAGPRENEIIVKPIRAETPFQFRFQSSIRTWENERDRNHRRAYLYDAGTPNRVRERLTDFFTRLPSITAKAKSGAELVEALREKNPKLAYADSEKVQALVENLQRPATQEALLSIMARLYDEHLVVEKIFELRSQLAQGVAEINQVSGGLPLRNRGEALEAGLPYPVDRFTWDPIIRRVLFRELNSAGAVSEVEPAALLVLGAFAEPQVSFDEKTTALNYKYYPQANLLTAFIEGADLTAGMLGRPLTREESRLLREHRRAVEARNTIRLAGHAVFVLIVFLIVAFYVRKFSRERKFNTYNTVLFSLPVLLALTVQAFAFLLAGGNIGAVGYLFPAGAIGMLGVLLLDVRMALLLVTWGCMLFALQVDLRYDYVIVGIFGGFTAVGALYTIRKRWEVFLASFLIGSVNAAVILITSFIKDPNSVALEEAGIGFVSGIASFLVLAILPLFERIGIVTDMQLLELTGLNNPLLSRMEDKAPGTWQHTLNVTKLAEAAATEIGVNYLLVRAGCYYHDVGKTAKPEYFTENQLTADDKMRHSELKPQMSTLIIKNHVKEGVEMAQQEGLPERIIDFIRQHHGTSVIGYFYHKAMEAEARGDTKEPVRIEDYRYPGPKPQTIEAAIVMLADAVEATATAKLSGKTVREDDIQQIVRTTIFEKFNDGQFDECNLTLRDLNLIRETFVDVLRSRFHSRIDYPKRQGEPGRGSRRDKTSGTGTTNSANASAILRAVPSEIRS